MKAFLLSMTLVFISVLLVSFFSIDACIDAGGQWINFGISWVATRGDFVPQ